MIKRIFLNNDWFFQKNFTEELILNDFDTSLLENVRIPHSNVIMPLNYFDESIYQNVSGYKKEIFIGKEYQHKRVILTLEGCLHKADLYVNESYVDTHYCGYTSFKIDITEHIKFNDKNNIVVKLDSNESLNIPPFGNCIDYMTYGGIYRDVYIDICEEIYLEDVFLYSEFKKIEDIYLFGQVKLNKFNDNLSLKVSYKLKQNDKFIFLNEFIINEKSFVFNNKVDVLLWDIDNPNLYDVKLELYNNEFLLDKKEIRFGFREIKANKDGLYLNGKKIKIRGLNRHQSYPYVGYAMPKSIQEFDALTLKYELGLNAVRTSHYPNSVHFINKCDEIGLLVFTEIPGWQYVGDSFWQEQAINNVKDMVIEYRNHPSIFIWGVRINESLDYDSFYKRTNEVCHNLDHTRPTGGVRNFRKSNLLEDVYTFNDFNHDGFKRGALKKKNVTSNINKGYLVTEYNGHMYPTKSFDKEEIRLEHALRHRRVLESIYQEDDIYGSFGWCMSDYNTHKDFGSGDRICHHGVLDIFRNKKLAAYTYSSLANYEDVLYISSTFDLGEKPACVRGKIYAFTNCDSIKMYKNDVFIKEYFNINNDKTLKNKPILIDDFIGNEILEKEKYSKKVCEKIKKVLNTLAINGYNKIPLSLLPTIINLLIIHHVKIKEIENLYTKYVGNWGIKNVSYKFIGIKNNEVVKTVIKEEVKEVKINYSLSNENLIEENTYDVCLIRLNAVDQNNNVLPYYNEAISVTTSTNLELIGDDVISFKGGMAGIFVKTKNIGGSAYVKIKSSQAKDVLINLNILIQKNVKEEK